MFSSSLVRSVPQFSRIAIQASLKSGLKFGPAVNTDFKNLQSRNFHAAQPAQGAVGAIITAAATVGAYGLLPLDPIGGGMTVGVGAVSTLLAMQHETELVIDDVIHAAALVVVVGFVGAICMSSDVDAARIQAKAADTQAKADAVARDRDELAEIVAAKVIKQLDSRHSAPVDKDPTNPS